jgi:hypothetical protein
MGGVTAKTAVSNHVDIRQQRCQSARCRAFGRATLAAYQNPANLRTDGVEDQGAFHALLSDDSGKWEDQFLHKWVSVWYGDVQQQSTVRIIPRRQNSRQTQFHITRHRGE